MSDLAPFEVFYDSERGKPVPLPAELSALYGKLELPAPTGSPVVLGNFVETLDGVVSLNVPGQYGGGEISGNNVNDRFLMGLLRSLADAVIVGAGTLRAVPQHLWTPDHIYSPMRQAYEELRRNLGKPGQPLNVIVTASGDLDHSLPVFSSGQVQTLVVTNSEGLARLRKAGMPDSVQVEATANSGPVSAAAVLQAVGRIRETKTVLVEGGPQLIADFFSEDLVHDLFLTLAPQLAGRIPEIPRPALIEGKQFAPEHPKWGRLAGVRRASDHLFLRYGFKDG